MGEKSHGDWMAMPGQKMFSPWQEALISESVLGSVNCGTAPHRTKQILQLMVLSCKKKERKLIK